MKGLASYSAGKHLFEGQTGRRCTLHPLVLEGGLPLAQSRGQQSQGHELHEELIVKMSRQLWIEVPEMGRSRLVKAEFLVGPFALFLSLGRPGPVTGIWFNALPLPLPLAPDSDHHPSVATSV